MGNLECFSALINILLLHLSVLRLPLCMNTEYKEAISLEVGNAV